MNLKKRIKALFRFKSVFPKTIEEYTHTPAVLSLKKAILQDFGALYVFIKDYDIYWLFKLDEKDFAAAIRLCCKNISIACKNMLISYPDHIDPLVHDGSAPEKLHFELLNYSLAMIAGTECYIHLTYIPDVNLRLQYMEIANFHFENAKTHFIKANTLLPETFWCINVSV